MPITYIRLPDKYIIIMDSWTPHYNTKDIFLVYSIALLKVEQVNQV